jgi:hypothetical protein
VSARRAALAVALLALATPPAAPAAADEPWGGCGYSALTGQREDGSYDVLLEGNVVLSSAGAPVSGTLTCTVVEGLLHGDPVLVTVTSDVTPVTAVIPPRVVTVRPAVWWSWVVPCTRVDVVGGGTYYRTYDATHDRSGEWSTEPEGHCVSLVGDAGPDLPGEEPDGDEADGVVCPVLAAALPPEGDVPGVWDCPPYGSER